uniref:TOG domain-containing protein n=1 Tax=Guillardia theta TaxID=55529 RepID=A0A7S4PE14_GUITH
MQQRIDHADTKGNEVADGQVDGDGKEISEGQEQGKQAVKQEGSKETVTNREEVAQEHSALTVSKQEKILRHILQDLDKQTQWKTKVSALKRLQDIFSKGSNLSSPPLVKMVRSTEFSRVVSELFGEIRSQLVKEAADTFEKLSAHLDDKNKDFKEYDQLFADFVVPEMLKAVCKGNPTISSTADLSLGMIVKNVTSPKLLRSILEPMADVEVHSKIRLACAKYLCFLLDSWPRDKLQQTSLDIWKGRMDAVDAVEFAVLKCLSDSKSETREAAGSAYEKFSAMFPARGAKMMSNMSKQQLRLVRAAGEGKEEDAETAGRVERKSKSLSPTRRSYRQSAAGAVRERQKVEGQQDERGRKKKEEQGEGQEVNAQQRMEANQLRERISFLEVSLENERKKVKMMQRLKDDAESLLAEERAARVAMEKESQADLVGEEAMREHVRKLKTEQARNRKLFEEREMWKDKCKQLELQLASRNEQEKKQEKKQATKEEKEEGKKEKVAPAGPVGDPAYNRKQEKVISQLKKKVEELQSKEAERDSLQKQEIEVLEEKLRGREEELERNKSEAKFAKEDMMRMKERWQLREKDWFNTRMSLEREVEELKALWQSVRQEDEHERGPPTASSRPMPQDEQDEGLDDEVLEDRHAPRRQPDAISPRAEEEQREAQEKMKELMEEIQSLKEKVLQQEAIAGEARLTASMAQKELHHWRQRVAEIEPERARNQVMIEKLRAELDWSMRNESQEQRRMKTLLAVAEEKRRRTEAQLEEILRYLRRSKQDVDSGKAEAMSVLKRIEGMMHEETNKVKQLMEVR